MPQPEEAELAKRDTFCSHVQLHGFLLAEAGTVVAAAAKAALWGCAPNGGRWHKFAACAVGAAVAAATCCKWRQMASEAQFSRTSTSSI